MMSSLVEDVRAIARRIGEIESEIDDLHCRRYQEVCHLDLRMDHAQWQVSEVKKTLLKIADAWEWS